MIEVNFVMILIILVVGSVVAYTFIPDKNNRPRRNKQKPPAKQNDLAVLRHRMDRQASVLKGQFEKLAAEYKEVKAVLKEELQRYSKKESEYRGEIERMKRWAEKERVELDRAKAESTRFKEVLCDKEKELAKEFSSRLYANKQLEDKARKLEISEKQAKEAQEAARLLQAKETGYKKEIDRLNSIVSQIRIREEESEWVSKKDYLKLKKDFEEFKTQNN